MGIKEVKKDILNMSYLCDAGHIPSALSHVDFLYYMFTRRGLISLKFDYIVVGKPYGAQAYYAIFKDLGLITNEELFTFGKTDSKLTHGITDKFPGIIFSEQTLGSAVGIGCGIALSTKQNKEGHVIYPYVWINISDAVLQAGTVWEAIMFAGAQNLKNIIMTVDYNNQQCTGSISDILPIEPLKTKFEAFGWNYIAANGHNRDSIEKAFEKLFHEYKNDKPSVIVFHTIKGRGIDFMECKPEWHYKCLDEENLLRCLEMINEKNFR